MEKNTTKKQKPRGYWETYENNYNEAQKYKSRKEFSKGCSGAYRVARKNGWLDNYTWFSEKKQQKPSGYWTYETCYQESLKYNSRSEFAKGCDSAYRVARKNGWLNNYTWFSEKKQQKPSGYWYNYENNYNEAKKYKSRSEFDNGNQSAYQVARKNGWIDNYTWFQKDLNPYKNKRDNVYCYIFEELKSVYIGRTININKRNKQHNTQTNSAVYKFAQKHNIVIPQITILETNLSLEEGLEREHFYVTKYKSEGWNVLNKAKTGKNSGSLGGLNNGIWTEQTCYKEALKYKSRNEFSNGNGSAYQVALKNSWLDNYTWFSVSKTSKKWTEQTCYQEALKYNSRRKFQKGCSSAYHVARKNGWLDIYTWFSEKQKRNYWNNYENNYNEARKYNSRKEFQKGCESAYQVALKNSWLDNYTWFTEKLKPSGYWENYENNYQEAQKYKSRSEFSKGCVSAYSVARKNSWLDNYTWFIEKKQQKPSGYWNYETCYQEAQKYKSRFEFSKGCSGAYNVAWKSGWLDIFYPKGK